jgi:beta-lactamase regulating signal transducer with metallopeptidase domain
MLNYLIQSAICLIFLYGLYFLLLRKETFFHWNRYYLLFISAISLCIPLLKIPLLKESQEQRLNQIPVIIEQVQAGPQLVDYQLRQPISQTFSLTLGDAIFWIYLCGFAALSLLFIWRLIRLFSLVRASKLRIENGYTIAQSDNQNTPASSFFQIIFFQESTHNQLENDFIFKHELAHVKGWHSLDVVLSEILTILQWFNPIAWQLRKSLRATHEYIADDWVVRNTQSRYEYALFLSKHAVIIPNQSNSSNLQSSFYSQLKNRLAMLAKTPSRAYRAYRYFFALPITVGLLMLFSFTILDNSSCNDLTSLTKNLEHIAHQIAETPIITTSSEVQIEETFIGLKTPYIFYWGHFQVSIMKHETSDIYFGEITLTHTEFLNSIDREPRLFNGKNLEDRTQFQVMAEDQTSLPVEALIGTESVYEKYRKELNGQFTKWQKVSRIDIKELSLPGGQKANLAIHFSTKHEGQKEPIIKKYTFDWGGTQERPRKLITTSEFWQMAASLPKYFMNEKEIKMPASITVVAQNGDPRILEFETGKPEGYAQVLESLRLRMDLIAPGTSVYLDFTNAPSNVFYIVDDNDPRLGGNRILDFTTPDTHDQPHDKIRILEVHQTPTKVIYIGYEIKENTDLTITVKDPDGVDVYSSKRHFNAGKHAIELNSEIFTPGEYTVVIKSVTDSADRKLTVK